MLLFFTSCISRTEIQCSSSKECYESLGVGYVCASLEPASTEENYCIRPTKDNAPERFQEVISSCTTYPQIDGTDVFSDWTGYENYHLIGHIFEEEDKLPIEVRNEYINAINLVVGNPTNPPSLAERKFLVVHCPFVSDTPSEESKRDLHDVLDFMVMGLQVPVTIGPYYSNVSLQAIGHNNAYSTKGNTPTVLISPSATTTSLITGNYFWRTIADDSIQAPVLGHLIDSSIEENNISKIITITDRDSNYSNGLLADVKTYLDQASVSTEDIFFSNANDLSTDSLESILESEIWNDIWAGQSDSSKIGILFLASEKSQLDSFVSSVLSEEITRETHLFFSEIALGEGALDVLLTSLLEEGTDLSTINIHGTYPYIDKTSLVYTQFSSTFLDFSGGASIDFYTPNTYDAAWLALYSYWWGYRNTVFPDQEAHYLADKTLINDGLKLFNKDAGNQIQLFSSNWNTNELCLGCQEGFHLLGAAGVLDFVPDAESHYNLIRDTEIWNMSCEEGLCAKTRVHICSSNTEIVDCREE